MYIYQRVNKYKTGGWCAQWQYEFTDYVGYESRNILKTIMEESDD